MTTNKKKDSKIKKWLCKVFGHKFDDVDLTVARIQAEAINRNEQKIRVVCKRCGYILCQ